MFLSQDILRFYNEEEAYLWQDRHNLLYVAEQIYKMNFSFSSSHSKHYRRFLEDKITMKIKKTTSIAQ